jgi:hypothetical protein
MQPALGPATRLVGLYGRSLATTLPRPDSETTPAGVLEKLVETFSTSGVARFPYPYFYGASFP